MSLAEFLIEHSRTKISTGNLGMTLAAALAAALVSPAAEAMQPLEEFTKAARVSGLDEREARLLAAQRRQEAEQAGARLWPVVTLGAGYTRSQYAAEATLPQGAGLPPKTITITPHDQYDLTARLDVPLLDVGAWRRSSAAEASHQAALARQLATRQEVEKAAVRSYYQLAGFEALREASQRAVQAAEETARVTQQRKDAGLVSDLEVERSKAEVERNRQTLADVDLAIATGRRSLETLTGLAPTPGAPPLAADDLREEASLEAWGSGDSLPQIKAARMETRALEKSASAAYAALWPSLSFQATERYTNAVGFGQSPSYTLGLSLTVRLDASVLHGARAQDTAAELARLREERARQQARDALQTSWHQTRAQLAKARSARAQVAAAQRAAAVARQRYAAGTATLLDTMLAERDAFSAEASRIQADAELLSARATLRLSAGKRSGEP